MSIHLFDPALRDTPAEWPVVEDHLLRQLLPRAGGLLRPDQYALLERIAKSRWFLLRNDGPATDRARCTLCGRRHRYLTKGCIERPFNGLSQVHAAVKEVSGDGRGIGRRQVAFGDLVPVSEAKAQQLLGRIRALGYRV